MPTGGGKTVRKDRKMKVSVILDDKTVHVSCDGGEYMSDLISTPWLLVIEAIAENGNTVEITDVRKHRKSHQRNLTMIPAIVSYLDI